MSEPVYRIKPLEWRQEDTGIGYWWADTILGQLRVREKSAPVRFFWYLPPYQSATWKDWEGCASIDDGKSKAEAWYRAKLLEALEEVR